MSNHMGSHMLNEVVELLDENKIFELIGKDKTLSLIKDIIEISDDYDCNSGEILADVGERLGICYYCVDYAEDIEHGICDNCI